MWGAGWWLGVPWTVGGKEGITYQAGAAAGWHARKGLRVLAFGSCSFLAHIVLLVGAHARNALKPVTAFSTRRQHRLGLRVHTIGARLIPSNTRNRPFGQTANL